MHKHPINDAITSYASGLYRYYNPETSENNVSENVWHYVVIFLLTPAALAIVYVTWRFGNSLLKIWAIEPTSIRAIRIKPGGRTLWRVKAGSLTLFAVAALLFAAVTVSSSLDNILFSALPAEIHREGCVVSEASQSAGKDVSRRNMNVNLFYFNDETRAQIVSPLYLAFYKRPKMRFETEGDRRIILGASSEDAAEEDLYHQEEQTLDDDIAYVVRIDASELLWLSGKGLIVEGGERRFYRLQFAADQLKVGDDFTNYIGSVPCKLLIPVKGEVTQVGTDSRNAPVWRLNLKSRQADGKESLSAINARDVNGDTSSDIGATEISEGENPRQ